MQPITNPFVGSGERPFVPWVAPRERVAAAKGAPSPARERRRFRLAVVLHGRMGGLLPLRAGAAPRATRSLDGATPSLASAAMCAFSLERHVIAPNVDTHSVDVFGHSWSPEIGAALDALYSPRRSAHEPGISAARFTCPNTEFSPRYCHRTVSHILGISRAMALKRQEEVERGFEYDAVFLSRWDVVWRYPFRFGALPGWHWAAERRRRAVWLPRICAPIKGGGAGGEYVGMRLRLAVCGGAASVWEAPQAAHACSAGARACQGDMSAEAREMYVMDWWLLLGSSTDADEFATGMWDDFRRHGTRIAHRLASRPQHAVAMGHAWFGSQLLWSMNATLWYTGNIGIDFHLGRAWTEFECAAMRPRCAHKVCAAADVLRRPWQGPNSYWPNRTDSAGRLNATFAPLATFPDPRSSMAHSCEDRYFTCKKRSRMCDEAEAHDRVVDRPAGRALFLGCAENLCVSPLVANASGGVSTLPPMNSSACGLSLIQLYLELNFTDDRGSVSADGPFPAPTSAAVHADVISRLRQRLALGLAAGGGSSDAPLARMPPECERARVRSDGGARPWVLGRVGARGAARGEWAWDGS